MTPSDHSPTRGHTPLPGPLAGSEAQQRRCLPSVPRHDGGRTKGSSVTEWPHGWRRQNYSSSLALFMASLSLLLPCCPGLGQREGAPACLAQGDLADSRQHSCPQQFPQQGWAWARVTAALVPKSCPLEAWAIHFTQKEGTRRGKCLPKPLCHKVHRPNYFQSTQSFCSGILPPY